MNYNFDDKQKKIITSWLELSRSSNDEPYFAFIALWISFNAYCSALYANNAQKLRADLYKDRGLKKVTGKISSECTIVLDAERFKIEIEKPDRISITVSEKYSEETIFSEFAEKFQQQYSELLENQDFHKSVITFQNSIYKEAHDKHYVVNMGRSRDYDSSGDFQSMVGKNIIVLFERIDDLKQLKNALYQVRCNVFHGEKMPGLVNDDRIVKTAYPVLLKIMELCVSNAE